MLREMGEVVELFRGAGHDDRTIERWFVREAGRRPHFDRDVLCRLMLTGWGQDGDRARARAAGFDAHLTRPVEPELILAIATSRPPDRQVLDRPGNCAASSRISHPARPA